MSDEDEKAKICQKHIRGNQCRRKLKQLRDGMDFYSLNKFLLLAQIPPEYITEIFNGHISELEP